MAVTKLSNSGIKTGVLKYDSMLAGNPPYSPGQFDSIASVSPTGVNTVTFSAIPQNYKYLQLRGFIRDVNGGTNNCDIRFNGSTTTSHYAYHEIRGQSAVYSFGTYNTQGYANNLSFFNNGTFVIDIYDYADTTKSTTSIARGGRQDISNISTILFTPTAAITSITIFNDNNYNYQTGSFIALYGVLG